MLEFWHGRYGQKNDFSKWSQKTAFSSKCWYFRRCMSILKIDLQRTTIFLKCYFRICAKIDFIKVISQQRNFPRNFHIFGHKHKNLFFSGRSKEKYLYLEFWYFRRYGQKTDIFKVISKNCGVYVGYSELGGRFWWGMKVSGLRSTGLDSFSCILCNKQFEIIDW